MSREARAGDGVPKHAPKVRKAIAACELAGAEFWALGRNPRVAWGVRNGEYVEVSIPCST